MKKLYKFYVDFGRSGDLDGIFVAEENDINDLITSKVDVYFGEVLGKHSEVVGQIEEKHITVFEASESFINEWNEKNLDSGYNPLNYMAEGYDTALDYLNKEYRVK